MAEIINVTSEALQQQIRDLLPSQAGFGEDLQASNVILPIIDLTRTAEGSTVPDYLQNALAFGSQTAFDANTTSATIANSPGFYRIIGGLTFRFLSDQASFARFNLTDGLSTKIVYQWTTAPFVDSGSLDKFDFNVFLKAGESLTAVTSHANTHLSGSSRQIADVNGTLVNPDGFSPQ